MNNASSAYQLLKAVYRFLKINVFYGMLLLPLGRARHRKLLLTSDRSNSHTYTCFYRSPLQLEALCSPVLDYLKSNGAADLAINLFAGSNGAEAYTLASELLYRRPGLNFRIKASDLHAEMVAKATAATYSMPEITQGLTVPADFIARTFDKVGDQYVVKPQIRAKVSFQQADLLNKELYRDFPPADIVVAQNVLFHMPPPLAREAFTNIIRSMKPKSVLLLDGMELDMRVEVTTAAGLKPLAYKVREIYNYSRRHIPDRWWEYYFGNEPYFYFSRQRLPRYCTIFFK